METRSSVKHCGRITWAGVAASGTGSLLFTDESDSMNSEVFRAKLSVQIQSNTVKPIGQHSQIMTQNTLRKSNPRSSQGNKKRDSSVAQSVTWFQLNRAAFQLLKTNRRQIYKQTATEGSGSKSKASQERKTVYLVFPMGSRLKVINWREFPKGLCNTRVLWLTAEILHFNHTMISSFQLYFDSVKRQNYKKSYHCLNT